MRGDVYEQVERLNAEVARLREERDEALTERDKWAQQSIRSLASRDALRAELQTAQRESASIDRKRVAALDERDALRAVVARLESGLEDIAEHECAYGDGCPTFGTNHGKCVGCVARAALEPK